MICAVEGPEALARYNAALAGGGPTACCLGARCAAFAALPGSGWRFFTGGAHEAPLALAVRGHAAQLAGRADPEELSLLLGMLGVRALRTEERFAPSGWREENRLAIYSLASGAGITPQPPIGFALETRPSLWAVTQLLAGGQSLAEGGRAARDDFYADACVLCNRGLARIWAARGAQGLAATAGAYAIWGGRAYLSAVETVPGLRRRGLGRWLVSVLAAELVREGLRVELLCAPGREAFYEALGFAPGGQAVCWARGPG